LGLLSRGIDPLERAWDIGVIQLACEDAAACQDCRKGSFGTTLSDRINPIQLIPQFNSNLENTALAAGSEVNQPVLWNRRQRQFLERTGLDMAQTFFSGFVRPGINNLAFAESACPRPV